MTVEELPAINAALNACATVAMCAGIALIKAGRRRAHTIAMSTALVFSAAFLSCYLYYHYHAGHVKFAGPPAVAKAYYVLLATHIILAVANLPMIIMTVVPALRERFDRHKRLAKITFPVWLYVSVTGVIVYFMCYHWYGPPIR